ncbi:MAG: nitrilase-related carbon-nitrogen hydrolase, partial [Candidatus Bathyarchaeia archaeon]
MVKVGLIQMECVEDKNRNVEKALRFIHDASEKGAKIICLQEVFSTQYVGTRLDSKYFNLAEPIPGPTIAKVSRAAKEHKVSIVAPIFEEDTYMKGKFYNSAAVLDPNGELLGIYRKTHIPQQPGFQEKFYFAVGNIKYPVFQLPEAKIGVYICYDRHFPEGLRAQALKGAEIVFIPTCTCVYRELWELEVRAHAAFNQIFVAGLNRVGKESSEQTAPYYGHSCVANPRGEIIAQAGDDEELLIVDIDTNYIREYRKNAPFFWRDRAPHLYSD